MNPLNVLIRLVDKTEIFIVLFWGNNVSVTHSTTGKSSHSYHNCESYDNYE